MSAGHAAAQAQRTAEVIGTVHGRPVRRDRLDRRLAALRNGPGAAALPVAGSGEGRQLVRWTAHVLFTEELCAGLARRAGVDTGAAPPPLDALGAVQLGSVNAAAWRSHPAVGALFTAFAGAVARRPAPVAPAVRRWRLAVAEGATPQAAAGARPASIGWTTLADLPLALADAARPLAPGEHSAPVYAAGTWHVVHAVEVADAPLTAPGPDRPDPTVLVAFARRLDLERARSVRPAPGFEHPGDPAQPDNTHRH
ncbi:DUF7158 domain-containing protein [Streptantibioticus cattleyicolor]|uniref:PpiC domain-containing protein n=1 Tax=Streptantibioticus cattleyicolor (strain ATCC 35852 / DSM 46488 / JCM 4925 / NBRC 14057 / NRRL 8057) TaxID=1003195 RepID=F8JMM3_STREN|nr:peptidyl-prolyl cis-trans isomerase [Streptantibioticus cattleyicolor]AEW98908.1 hypothetical protein SCATT_p07150 [Streptantibioticus cattleyicolor NRRL 8057 = DSM 46488]CCB72045.1 conserved protein of unknown function [Streptantibioticus cattleyicolor NRRL 8057 = DSM 46488]